MRLNKRLIKNAPKRGPDELEIELLKLKMMKAGSSLNSIITAFKTFTNNLKNAIISIGNALYSVIKPVIDSINSHEKYKKEDSELFQTLPSVWRFEHNMI